MFIDSTIPVSSSTGEIDSSSSSSSDSEQDRPRRTNDDIINVSNLVWIIISVFLLLIIVYFSCLRSTKYPKSKNEALYEKLDISGHSESLKSNPHTLTSRGRDKTQPTNANYGS